MCSNLTSVYLRGPHKVHNAAKLSSGAKQEAAALG